MCMHARTTHGWGGVALTAALLRRCVGSIALGCSAVIAEGTARVHARQEWMRGAGNGRGGNVWGPTNACCWKRDLGSTCSIQVRSQQKRVIAIRSQLG